MINSLGSSCRICDSNVNITYMHIVPLKNGGTNRMTNIVPLCNSCYCKASGRSNSTWDRLTKEYRNKHNIDKSFRNNIDIKLAKKRRLEAIG